MRGRGTLVVLLSLLTTCGPTGTWGWKRGGGPDDVMKFLNGTSPYNTPVAEARIAAVKKPAAIEFTVFYMAGKSGGSAGNWAWKFAGDVTDALNFLNGQAPYSQPVANAEITAIPAGAAVAFYIFYQPVSPTTPAGSWAVQKLTDPDSVMRFLNGSAPGGHPVSTARVVGVGPEFYVFYRSSSVTGGVANWAWKKSVGADGPGDVQTDMLNFVNGIAPYAQAVTDFEFAAAPFDQATSTFYAFYNQGSRLWIERPLEGERFVIGENVPLQALYTSHLPTDAPVTWSPATAAGLTAGTHAFTASAGGDTRVVTLRLYADLGTFYQAAPSTAELDRIKSEFTLTWLDGNAPDEKWAAYAPPLFDQTSLAPSALILEARLDVMRHQAFAEPLPFGDGLPVYEHFRTGVHALELRLDCFVNHGGSGGISLDRNQSTWWNLIASDCKTPGTNAGVAPYVHSLYLLVHEGRHNQPGDPSHTTCNGESNMDATLDGGSGHAWAALYTMWVYKYGLYDPPEVKAEAKSIATQLLESRFCTKPSSADPKVQAIVSELLP